MRPLVVSAAVAADADELAAGLRDQDKTELDATGNTDHAETIRRSIDGSAWAYTVRSDGEIVAIFGLAVHGSALAPIGVPWLLGTDKVLELRRNLVRLAPLYIRRMLRETPRLINFVHAENSAAVRWLRRSGFKLHEPQPFGPHGAPFHQFEMTADV